MKPLTVRVSSGWTLLLLLLSACLTLTARADCGADCALCSTQLPAKYINSIECVLECEGHLNAGSWSLCQRFMQNADSTPESDRAPAETHDLGTHQVDKKYGGFMKRYGGFMKRYGGFMKRYGGFMKRTAELYGLEPEDDQGLADHDAETLTNQIEEREVPLGDDSEAVRGLAKRYGGFMKRGSLYELGSEVRPLQKRYGGFMRRVGRPEWWQETKRYGGFFKRSPEEDEDEDSLEVEKRYGGFMEY